MNFGLEEENGHLKRRTPITLMEGAKKLAEEVYGWDSASELALKRNYEQCLDVLRKMFLWSSKVKGLPFPLHQFISQGGSAYATLEPHNKRQLTLEGQYKTTGDRLLFPLVFCRECGQDYYVVRYDAEHQQITPLLPTAIDEQNEDIQEGYITLDEEGLWDIYDEDRLPDNWFRNLKSGRKIKPEFADFIPRQLYVYNDPHAFQHLAQEALDICHFKQDKASCTQACYECLLSYQNQFDHPYLDRHLIKDFLVELSQSKLTCPQGDREERYSQLLGDTDPNSDYERLVLRAIYQQGLLLPDKAQEYFPDAQCKPDFIYTNAKIALFCDGSVHDNPDRQQRDLVQRQDLDFHTGYKAFTFNYLQDLDGQVNQLKALFD
jgi:hypothetical protein